MTSRQPSAIVDCQGTITPHLAVQTVSGAEGFEGLVAAGGPPSATAPGARLKHRTRKFAASGSLSDSSSSVKRQESSPTLTLISSKFTKFVFSLISVMNQLQQLDFSH